jgi:hypothetical protein
MIINNYTWKMNQPRKQTHVSGDHLFEGGEGLTWRYETPASIHVVNTIMFHNTTFLTAVV